MSDPRLIRLDQWARQQSLPESIPSSSRLEPVSDDASFRRYFRYNSGVRGLVFVDAPPAHEDNVSFIKIAQALEQAGLSSPHLFAYDIEDGYLVVADLGDDLYQRVTERSPAITTELYDQALATLVRVFEVVCDVPLYSEQKLTEEVNLFEQWFLKGQLDLRVSDPERKMLANVTSMLVASAEAQPKGFVHRDYHCRNLLVLPDDGPGIIDFQDAVIGPVTYDLVSLLKDCYFKFDRATVEARVMQYHETLRLRGTVPEAAPFLRWFDWMGVQRHMKCAGIFSRLNLRDGKPGYLGDIPLVIDYLIEASGLYSELSEFNAYLVGKVLPRMQALDFQRAPA